MEIHVHIHHHSDQAVMHKLDYIIKHQNKMGVELDEIKATLVISDEKIDILTTATAGVSQDVAFIKAKLDAAGAGGIDAAGVAELKGLVSAQSEKLTAAAQALADLDASTDSTGV